MPWSARQRIAISTNDATMRSSGDGIEPVAQSREAMPDRSWPSDRWFVHAVFVVAGNARVGPAHTTTAVTTPAILPGVTARTSGPHGRILCRGRYRGWHMQIS